MKSVTRSIAFTALAAAAAAQDPILANGAGQPLTLGTVAFPVTPPTAYTVPLALSPDAHVYAALPDGVPTGYYSFDVVDVLSTSLSQLNPEDRIFAVVNNGAAGYSISRVNASPSLPAVGDGLGGVGDSIPVFPFNSPLPVAGRPDLTCVQKVILSSHGAATTNPPVFFGSRHFRIGDGSPGTVSGVVFRDLNQNGVRDAGEPGMAGSPVQLVPNDPLLPTMSTQTDANGQYLFANVAVGADCHVVLQLNSQYQATTPTDVHLSSCGCGNQVVDFGIFVIQQQCIGRTIGFWRNNNGVAIIQNGGFWDELAALNLVNLCGQSFNPTGNVCQWRFWLQGANAFNMAYMLSAQLAAMQLNVLSGGVHAECWVQTAQGPMTIANLMAAANAALALDPFTLPCDPNRYLQAVLKNALDAANNNLNWL